MEHELTAKKRHKMLDEITKREPYDGYLVYQGGVPEVEEFVKKVRK